MYFITTKRMLEVCFSAHPNIQYRTNNDNRKRGNPVRNNPAGFPLFLLLYYHKNDCFSQ
ncbi:hypothetical protein HMPREF1020_02891 [Clostridium sp. 7_3_54FAA]|nr:hypothetical protein HMPREF1020_02891 [Clostridium sp. 7_3_54FAA]